jgi:hypothetical protein
MLVALSSTDLTLPRMSMPVSSALACEPACAWPPAPAIVRLQMMPPPRLPIWAAFIPPSSASPPLNSSLPNAASPMKSKPSPTCLAISGALSVRSKPIALPSGSSVMLACLTIAQPARSSTPAAPVERPLTVPSRPIASCSPIVDHRFSLLAPSGPRAAAGFPLWATIPLNSSSRSSSSS